MKGGVLLTRFLRFLKAAALVALLALPIASPAMGASEGPRYIFLFIGDGMGEAQVKAADLYSRASGRGELAFAALPARGRVTTGTAKGAVTDSAAAGTALASGHKTENGILNMDPSKTKRFITVAMLARDRGMRVGVVTSSFMNDSTPAAFYAWSPSRTELYEIGSSSPTAASTTSAGEV